MADPCVAIRKKTATLEEEVADLKGDIAGATGSVLHGLARQLNVALRQLARAQGELAACEAANPAGGNPPVVVPPVVTPPVGGPPATPDPCLANRMTVAVLEEDVADLRDQIAGATGSVLHGLVGQLVQALHRLASAQRALAACEHTFAGWAILLCHWSDNSAEPQNRQFFEDLFTSSGAGSLNMTDYFADSSHGRIDFAGTEVFGWFDMGFPRSAYVGLATPGPNQFNRASMLDRAKAVAREQGVDLSEFFGVLVCFNVTTDLFGGGAGACCDLHSLEPSLLGQEMGHVYGLDHSRRNGSNDDYQDNWDTMSTLSATFRAPHPRWTEVGPGLNGMNMRSQKWLDEKRVWRSSKRDFDQVIELRPLHRRDLPGFLGADLPGQDQPLFVEFRDKDRWDAGIPQPVVLVHRFEGNHSYIMSNTAGGDSLVKGGALQYGEVNAPSRAFGGVEVLDIDGPNRTARVRVHHRAATGIIAAPPTELVSGTGTEDAVPGPSAAVRGTSMKTLVALARREFVKPSELTSPAPKVKKKKH